MMGSTCGNLLARALLPLLRISPAACRRSPPAPTPLLRPRLQPACRLQQAPAAGVSADNAAAPAAPARVRSVGAQGQGGQHLQGGAQGCAGPRGCLRPHRWVLGQLAGFTERFHSSLRASMAEAGSMREVIAPQPPLPPLLRFAAPQPMSCSGCMRSCASAGRPCLMSAPRCTSRRQVSGRGRTGCCAVLCSCLSMGSVAEPRRNLLCTDLVKELLLLSLPPHLCILLVHVCP